MLHFYLMNDYLSTDSLPIRWQKMCLLIIISLQHILRQITSEYPPAYSYSSTCRFLIHFILSQQYCFRICLLRTEHYRQFTLNSHFLESFSDCFAQPAMISIPYIGKTDLSYIALCTGSHAGDYLNMSLHSLCNQMTFWGQCINSIHYKIIGGRVQQFRNIFIFQKYGQYGQFNLRINVPEAFLQISALLIPSVECKAGS